MARGVLVITGPTATGKTALGVLLAEALGGEVVSADAMQLYRGMVIGTAAPTAAETRGVPHHMVGVADPREAYSVGRYVGEAAACVDDILARGRLPILVGGTGLYIDALLRGLTFAGGDSALRASLSGEYDALGGEAMLARLRQADPERADKLAPNDKKRVVRALEVYLATGKTISQHDRESRERPPRYASCTVALSFRDRAELYRRIDQRVDRMFAGGLAAEVAALLAVGCGLDGTAMQAIGYKETAAALRGECSLSQAAEAVKLASRRYAKRQLSWLRAKPEVNWFLWENVPNFQEACLYSTRKMEITGIL